MVLLIIIPIKWLFHWEYTLFSDKPIYNYTTCSLLLFIPHHPIWDRLFVALPQISARRDLTQTKPTGSICQIVWWLSNPNFHGMKKKVVAKCMHGWMEGWKDGWMDGCMDGCISKCMYVCMYVCMYTYIYIYVYMYVICICIYIYMHVCMYYMDMDMDMDVCVCTCLCLCICIYIYSVCICTPNIPLHSVIPKKILPI